MARGRNARSAGAWAAAQPVTLKPLHLAPDAPRAGVAASIGINNATPGSALTVTAGALPPGMVLDSAGRKITGAAAAGIYSFTLTETLGGAVGSPRATAQQIVITAAPKVPAGVDAFAAQGIAPNGLNASNRIGTRIIGGRMERITTIAASMTFELLIACAAPEVEAVRLILAAGYDATATASIANITVGAAAVPSTLPADINAQTFTSPGQVTLARGAVAGRRSIVRSPWINVPSVPRTDGGTLPLYALRAYFPASTVVGLNDAAANDSFTNWITHPSGRIFRMRQQAVNGITTPTDFTTVIDQQTTPIIGIQYLARGKVYNLAGFGDSIDDGRGTYKGEGAGMLAAILLSQEFGVPFEWSNLAWSGTPMQRIADQPLDAIAAGLKFDVAFMPVGTPNSLTVPIPDTGNDSVAWNRLYHGKGAALLVDAGIPLIPRTVLPVDPASKNWDASDSKRRVDINDALRAQAAKGLVIADTDAVLAGATDADGQVLPKAGKYADATHPGDAGNADMAMIYANAAKRILAPQSGALVTA